MLSFSLDVAEPAGSINEGWFGGTEKTSDPKRTTGPIQTRPGTRENGNSNINYVPLADISPLLKAPGVSCILITNPWHPQIICNRLNWEREKERGPVSWVLKCIFGYSITSCQLRCILRFHLLYMHFKCLPFDQFCSNLITLMSLLWQCIEWNNLGKLTSEQ